MRCSSAYSAPWATKRVTFAAGYTGCITGIATYTGLKGTVGTISGTYITTGVFCDLTLDYRVSSSSHVAHYAAIQIGNGFFV
jgi:hypothetical protein